MARKEIARSKGRRGPPPEDKQAAVRMPGSGVMMLGPVAIGAPSSPKQLGPRNPNSNVASLAHMPVKK